MILLHVAVAALYALAAWALWPKQARAAPEARDATPGVPDTWTAMLVPAALLLHAWMAGREFATPEGHFYMALAQFTTRTLRTNILPKKI